MAKIESLGHPGDRVARTSTCTTWSAAAASTPQGWTSRRSAAAIAELEHDGQAAESAVFQAGDVVLVVSQPRGEGGRAWR